MCRLEYQLAYIQYHIFICTLLSMFFCFLLHSSPLLFPNWWDLGGISFPFYLEKVQKNDCYCWIGTSIFLLIISVKFILKHNYKNKIVLFLHSYFCQSSLPLCHYNTTTQNNMILSYAAVYSGLWVLLNARFLR